MAVTSQLDVRVGGAKGMVISILVLFSMPYRYDFCEDAWEVQNMESALPTNPVPRGFRV